MISDQSPSGNPISDQSPSDLRKKSERESEDIRRGCSTDVSSTAGRTFQSTGDYSKVAPLHLVLASTTQLASCTHWSQQARVAVGVVSLRAAGSLDIAVLVVASVPSPRLARLGGRARTAARIGTGDYSGVANVIAIALGIG